MLEDMNTKKLIEKRTMHPDKCSVRSVTLGDMLAADGGGSGGAEWGMRRI